ncbi:AI-2E family transporter [Aphanothece hegewaldii CCALA 016]|uniref:AI-2E family transporter n=1 Tax=Aphanothece hegewaldii CCALA 016 TaxID=2107694 RepID=A0A2T1LUS8_9CHRO|nr:AI-2E family transporter [Aphanothece hegewaldii]PSF35315.1 AI-2E family transporter [Aphanothece hegewaldii CCALA 016]
MMDFFDKLPRWLQIGIIFPIAFLNSWLLVILIGYLEPLISIFVTATILAFLLDFPVRILQDKGIRREIAVSLVLLISVLALVLLVVILVPLIVQQLNELIISLPSLLEASREELQSAEHWTIIQNLSINVKESIDQLVNQFSLVLQSLSSNLLNFIVGTIGSIANVAFVLILTVFLVLTGEQVWDGVFSWIPTPWNTRLRESLQQRFENYFASQAILAGILSIAQTIVFGILNVPYAVLFGVLIGVTTLIPYMSAVTIIIISSILMLQQFSLGLQVLIAAFVVGQINDNIVAPRLMGGMTGLNPVWIIISLFIGGKVGGILGLLIAVPLASVIKGTTDSLRDSNAKNQNLIIETVKNTLE